MSSRNSNTPLYMYLCNLLKLCVSSYYRMDKPTNIPQASRSDRAADKPLQEINGEKKKEGRLTIS